MAKYTGKQDSRINSVAKVTSATEAEAGAGQGIAMPNLVKSVVDRLDKQWSGLAAGLINSMFQISAALAVAAIGGLFYAVLGSATDVMSVAHAYSIAATTIGACLPIAAWLISGVTEASSR